MKNVNPREYKIAELLYEHYVKHIGVPEVPKEQWILNKIKSNRKAGAAEKKAGMAR